MSTSNLPLLDAEHPWPGLFPYGENAHAFFNGRERETAELLRLVRREGLSLLYGQSGLGKSSLLRAGLFPRLRAEGFLPVYLRLDFRSRDIGLREQAWATLAAAYDEAGVDGPRPSADEPLWAYFHRADLALWDNANRLLLPVLVFDQFEEIVQAAEERELAPRLSAFMQELADLVENRVPRSVTQQLEDDPEAVHRYDFQALRFHCVLGFREDFLADMEQLFTQHGMAPQNRLRITRMQEAQALAAVARTGGALLDADVAERIVRFVSAAGGAGSRATIEIEPALLSVVCFELNNRRLQQGAAQISADLLTGAQEQIISEFYDRSVAGLGDSVQEFMERELLTESGYRDSCALEDAVHRHGVPREALQALVDRRVLRQEERFGVLRVELTHDVLAPVVRERRDARVALERRRREQEQEARRTRRLRTLLAVGTVAGALCVTLVVVFFNLFRQAEAEKARVIEAQSTLFLSRANVSLENNIPGEPAEYLAQAVRLHAGNEGAVARLASYLAQRRFARKLWEQEFGVPADGFSTAVPLGADAYAFSSAAGSWRIGSVVAGSPVPGLRQGCITPPADPQSWTMPAAATPQLTEPSGGARVATAEFVLARAPDCAKAASPAAAAASAAPAARNVKAVEPATAATWEVDGKNLVRRLEATAMKVPLAADAAEVEKVWPAAGGRAVVVAAASGTTLHVLEGKAFSAPAALTSIPAKGAVFDDAGRHVVLVLPDGQCQLWQVAPARSLWTAPCLAEPHAFVAGQPWMLLSVPAESGHGIEVRSLASGDVLARMQQPLAVNHIGTRTDGTLAVLSSQDRTARVLRLPSLQPESSPLLHEGAVVEASFMTGEGDRLVTASFDGAARLWNWRTGRLLLEPMLHPGPVLFARPTAGGNELLTLGDDRRLRLWRVSGPQPTAPQDLLMAGVSRDGTRMALVQADAPGRMLLAKLPDAPQATTIPREPLTVRIDADAVLAVFNAEGSRVAIAGREPWLQLVRAADGSTERRLALPAPARRVQFDAAQARIVVQLADDTLRNYDLATGKQLSLPMTPGPDLLDWGLSADGRWLSAATPLQVQVFDALTGYSVTRLGPGGILAAAVHPTRPEIAFATRGGLGIWRPVLDTRQLPDPAARKAAPILREIPAGAGVMQPVNKLLAGIRYSPNGERLGTFSIDGLVSTWDAATLAQGVVMRHSSSVLGVAFSDDGRWLVTRALDAQARIWDPRTGQAMSDPVALGDGEREFRLLGRGTWALVQKSAKPARFELRVVGLGFDGPAPGWVVPTAMAMAGAPSAAAPANAGAVAAADAGWWDGWLRHVAARNGVGIR